MGKITIVSDLSVFFPPVWSLSRFTAIPVSFRGTGLLPLYIPPGTLTKQSIRSAEGKRL